MADTLEGLTEDLRAFAEERDWIRFHRPRSLALALAGEVGELCAELQWEADDSPLDEELLAAVEMEMADTLIYLIRLSDVLDIDLLDAAQRKLAINRTRFPAGS